MIRLGLFRTIGDLIRKLNITLLLAGMSLFATKTGKQVEKTRHYPRAQINGFDRVDALVIVKSLPVVIHQAMDFLNSSPLRGEEYFAVLTRLVMDLVVLTQKIPQFLLDRLIENIAVDNFQHKMVLLMLPLLHKSIKLPPVGCLPKYKDWIRFTLYRYGISLEEQEATLAFYDLKHKQGWRFLRLLDAEQREFEWLVNQQKAELDQLALVTQTLREESLVKPKNRAINTSVLPPPPRFKRWVKKGFV